MCFRERDTEEKKQKREILKKKKQRGNGEEDSGRLVKTITICDDK